MFFVKKMLLVKKIKKCTRFRVVRAVKGIFTLGTQSVFGIKEMARVRAMALCTEERYTLALVFHVKIMSLTIIDLSQNE